MVEVWIRANGTPIPQGSKTAGVNGLGKPYLRDVNPKALKTWRETVAQATWRAMQEGTFQIDALTGPVEVICWFYFEKPKSNRTQHPTSRQVGDLDKLLRAVCDGMVDGGGMEDDSQICLISGSKAWADSDTRPGVMIYLSTLEKRKEPSKNRPRYVKHNASNEEVLLT